MTVRELIEKLSELPEPLKEMPVLVESDEGGTGELLRVRARIEGSKIWWEADAIILSSTY